MFGRFKNIVLVLLAVLTVSFLGLGLRGSSVDISCQSISPDGAYVVTLEEENNFIDRNFRLRLGSRQGERVDALLFTSPDEGPIGGEIVFWSPDSTCFILTGTTFFISGDHPDMPPRIYRPYLMHHIPSGRTWCNARQKDRFPSFSVRDAEALRVFPDGVLHLLWPE